MIGVWRPQLNSSPARNNRNDRAVRTDRELQLLEDLGNVGDFVGGIAVIATMFYLAVQIRRNTNATQASSMHEFLENWRALTRLSIENPSILDIHRRGMADYDALSDAERALVHVRDPVCFPGLYRAHLL